LELADDRLILNRKTESALILRFTASCLWSLPSQFVKQDGPAGKRFAAPRLPEPIRLRLNEGRHGKAMLNGLVNHKLSGTLQRR
jgi:hypothetical protein